MTELDIATIEDALALSLPQVLIGLAWRNT